MNSKFFKEVITVAKDYFPKDPAHDLDHALRVCNFAEIISKKEGGDLFIIKLSALLHDVGDHKFKNSKNNLDYVLNNLDISEDIKKSVLYIINNISYSKNIDSNTSLKNIEAKIVQDADRLDAIGVIGINRAIIYGINKNNQIFNKNVKPIIVNKKSYISNKGTIINHFFEKLLLLKDLLNTKTARKIAKKKHKFLIAYLTQFFDEYFINEDSMKEYWVNLLKKYK